MNLEDEASRSDRVIEIETDDEENEAERHGGDHDDDSSESDLPVPSSNPSEDAIDPYPIWPQSYRRSMDMYTSCYTPPTVSFISGNSFLGSAIRGSQIIAPDSSTITAPLISAKSEEVPTSTLPAKLSINSGSSVSALDLPPPRQCSFNQALLNAINGLCGIGILSTPFALKEGGWSGLSLFLLFGIITCYTGILLKKCLESSPGVETYPDIGQAAFGMAGRTCIAIVLYMELYSSCVEFLIMMSDNMSSMFPHAHLEFAGIHLDSYQICAITSTLVILPTVWLRNLSLLAYISAGGVIMLVVVILCLLWVGTINGVGFHMGGYAFNLAKLPVTVGLYSFCYGGHSIFPNIYSSMEEPSRFPLVLVISFSTACLLYAGVAICGFLMFGDSTKVQFTLNLPAKFAASGIAVWTVVLTPMTKYALTLTPIVCGVEELLPSGRPQSYGVSIFIRTILVASTLTIALTVPYFGSLMALIGSLLVMLVSLILPCACYMKIGSKNLTNLQIAVCTSIIILGLLCAVTGTYSAITDVAV